MVFLVTDGISNIDSHLTVPNTNALKTSCVDIYVVAVGSYIYGIDEIVKVASYPPENFLFRIKDYPGKYSIVNYDLPCY